MRKLGYVIPVCASLFLVACSWQEYFTVKNNSKAACRVRYTLDEKADGFLIFDSHPTIYPVNDKGEIEWGKDMAFADEDSSRIGVSLMLPPKSVLVFGHLSNDHYHKYNQEFINGRKFNLKSISVGTVNAAPETFDDFFKKRSGQVTLELK